MFITLLTKGSFRVIFSLLRSMIAWMFQMVQGWFDSQTGSKHCIKALNQENNRCLIFMSDSSNIKNLTIASMSKIHRTKIVMFVSAACTLFIVGGVYAAVKSKVLPVENTEAKKSVRKKTVVKKNQIPVSTPDEKSAESSTNVGQSTSQPILVQTAQAAPVQLAAVNQNPIHRSISTTYFWAGEEAGKENKDISNLPSAWDEQWVKHFGGVDDPGKRNGLVVASFSPKENPFYFALPYNDFDENGNRKKDAYTIVPWANSKKWTDAESMLKNQWIKITKGGKTAYAQWQDVGPFSEDDSAYVFGSAAPKSRTNDDAGLDVSPAVRDFLGLEDVDKTDWQFVLADQIPDGPWKNTVTTSQLNWN